MCFLVQKDLFLDEPHLCIPRGIGLLLLGQLDQGSILFASSVSLRVVCLVRKVPHLNRGTFRLHTQLLGASEVGLAVW